MIFISGFAGIERAGAQLWVPLGPFSKTGCLDSSDYISKRASGVGRVGSLKIRKGRKTTTQYLCTPFDRYRISTDNGASWKRPDVKGLPAAGIADLIIDRCHSFRMWAVTGDADCVLDPNGPAMNSATTQSRGIFRSEDGGANWTGPIGNWHDEKRNLIKDFWKYPSLKVCRRIVQSPTRSSVLMTIVTLCTPGMKRYDSMVYRSEDGGQNWYPVLSVTDGNFRELEWSINDRRTVYVAGRTLYFSGDRGKTWHGFQSSGLPADSLVARCEIAQLPGELFVLTALRSGRGNVLYQSTMKSIDFRKLCVGPASPEWRTSLAVDAKCPDLIYFTAGNTVNRFEHVGPSWRFVYAGNGLHDDIHELIADPAGGMYAATDGGLYETADGGKTWQDCSSGLNVAECWGVDVSFDGQQLRMMAGLQDCGTIQTELTAEKMAKQFEMNKQPLPDNISDLRWDIVRGGDGMKPIIHPTDINRLYVTDGNNNLNYLSRNGGKTWAGISLPRAGEAEYLRPFLVDVDDTARIWTCYKDVYMSADGGISWKSKAIPGATSAPDRLIAMAIAPNNKNIMYAGYSQPVWSNEVSGKLFRSMDGGSTWQDISVGLAGAAWASISSIAIHPQDPMLVVVGFRGGGAVKAMLSKTGGTGNNPWFDCSAGLPNSGDVNALCFDADSSFNIYAGTNEGVWKKPSMGSEWLDFNGSLPRVLTSDVVINNAAGLIVAGTHGAGIWVTRK